MEELHGKHRTNQMAHSCFHSELSLYRRALDLIRSFEGLLPFGVQNSSVLDIGCASGSALRAFERLGASRVVGLEYQLSRVQKWEQNADCHNCSARMLHGSILDEELALRTGGEFDLITCFDVIEHVPSPENAIASMARLLRPGGVIIITVANRYFPPHMLCEPHYGMPGMILLPQDTARAYFYAARSQSESREYEVYDWPTYESLARLFAENGFRVIPQAVSERPEIRSEVRSAVAVLRSTAYPEHYIRDQIYQALDHIESIIDRVSEPSRLFGVMHHTIVAQSPGEAEGSKAERDFHNAYTLLRAPKRPEALTYPPGSEGRIVLRSRSLGLPVEDFLIDVPAYRDYFYQARYMEDSPDYYPTNLPEKSLEHYLAAQFLCLCAEDVYIDIAGEHSPVPEIYHRLFGARCYRQDLSYPAGIHGDRIGGDAACMPIPAGFASKLALHCSFEHFEGEADIRFLREVERVLRPGGIACFVPLYLAEEYAIQTDPVVAVSKHVEFEQGVILHCAQGWGNRHARFYDPPQLCARVIRHLGHLKMTLYRITNATSVDPSCYVRFAMVVTKPASCQY